MSEPTEGENGCYGQAFDRYRKLVEASNDLITILDSEGTITYTNGAVTTILGYEPGEVTDGDGDEYIHPEDRDSVIDTFAAVRADSKATQTVEFRVRCADGRWCWVEARMQNLLDDIGGIVVTARDISKRKERGRELITTKERMELALEGANLGIWDWNMETDEVSRDELLTEMLGYSQSEMGHRLRGWEEIVHPDDRERHNKALSHHISNRTPYYQCDHRLQTKAGAWKWVRTMGKVVERDENGSPVRAVGIHQDIDERKRTKLTLEEERDLFTDGPAVVFKCRDAAGWPIEYVSGNVKDVFGYEPSELQSGDALFADFVHDDDLDRVTREIAELGEAGANRINLDPYRVLTAGGDVRWVMEYTKYVTNGDNDPRILGYLIDITERKQRERELQEREQKYRNLFEDTRDALMLLDRDGFFDCNKRTLELFGIDSVEAFVDHSPWELSPSTQPDGTDSKEAALQHIESAFEVGEAFFEWIHERDDGKTFPAEVKLSRFEYDGDLALHAMVRDISERYEYEEELEEQRDNLEILNQVVRHDIRNKLQIVLAYADMLQTEGADGDDEYGEIIREAAREAVEITTTARDVTEVMLQSAVERHPVQLSVVVEDEIEAVRSNYDSALVRFDGQMPDVSVRADDMLASVIRNILNNAIQHNDKEIPEVSVSAITHDGRVELHIADNGPGIPNNRKDEIFEQGEIGLDSDGTGLGLYLVDTLVDRYDGEVRIEDNDPGGADFIIELSIAEAV